MSEAPDWSPFDLRCQIYVKVLRASAEELERCTNEGTHWEKWPGCYCTDPLGHGCEGDFYSWECDSKHDSTEAIAC